MNYYQARISIETARWLEEMKNIYEKKLGVTITKGNVLMNAYEDSRWVKDWQEIHNSNIKPKKYEIKPNAQKLKIQISEQVEDGIKELKKDLPSIIGTRSVTIGVCIHNILKAAFIKNTEKVNDTFNSRGENSELIEIVDSYKDKVKKEIESGKSVDVLKILDDIKEEILEKFKR